MGKRSGRKRRIAKREPNGRPRRVATHVAEQDARRVALDYRRRVFGIKSEDLNIDSKAVTLIGRLCLQGSVSEAQWQAGEDWLGLVNARYAATNAPRGLRTAGNAAPALDEEAETERYWAVKCRFDDANAAVEDHAPVSERKERMRVLSLVVVQQMDEPKSHGTLRTALNGLVRFFRTEAA